MKRYPGLKPFEINEQSLFCGRVDDIERLYQSVNSNAITVVYAKSGLGKSSIINAGIVPLFEEREKNKWKNIFGRFTGYSSNMNHTLIQKLLHDISECFTISDQYLYLNKIDSAEIRQELQLWFKIKEFQATCNNNNFFFVFDQFEEVFTYPTELVIQLKKQLAQILKNSIPQQIKDLIHKNDEDGKVLFTEEELELLYQPYNLKILIAIRSDKLSEINSLKDYLPNILSNSFELKPLNKEQARSAITEPALKTRIEIKSKLVEFDSKRFIFQPEAVEYIIDFLTENGTKEIETFQLQIICESIERNIVIATGNSHIDKDDLVFINTVFEEYYESIVKKIQPEEDQLASRLLIEEGLIYEPEERRIPLFSGQILNNYNINSILLAKLVDSRIIRPIQNGSEGVFYEISHDTLVAPILKSKHKRIKLEEEEKYQRLVQAELQKKNEEYRIKEEEHKLALNVEKEKRKTQKQKYTLYSIIAILIISILAIFLERFISLEKDAKELNKDIAMIYKLQIKKNVDKKRYNNAKIYAITALKYDSNILDPGSLSIDSLNKLPNISSFLLNSENFIKNNNDSIKAIAFSTDGSKVAISYKGINKLYVYSFEETSDSLKLSNEKVISLNIEARTIKFSPSGKYLAISDSIQLLLYKVDTTDFKVDTNFVFDHKIKEIEFSLLENYVAIGTEKFIQLWDLNNNAFIKLKGEKTDKKQKIIGIESIAFNPSDSNLYVLENDNQIWIFDTKCNKKVGKIKLNIDIHSLLINSTNLFVGFNSKTIYIWNAEPNAFILKDTLLTIGFTKISGIRFNKEGTKLAIGYKNPFSGYIQIRNIEKSKKPIHEIDFVASIENFVFNKDFIITVAKKHGEKLNELRGWNLKSKIIKVNDSDFKNQINTLQKKFHSEFDNVQIISKDTK